MIASGTYAIHLGRDVAGLALIFAQLAGLIGAFAYGTRSRRKEREAKAALEREQTSRRSSED